MEDCLIIGADISNGKSITCITVARKNGENIEIINQLFDKEAEDIYYKLININAKSNFSKIKDEAIRRGMSKLSKIYSLKEMLEVLQYTEKLKQYTNKEIKFIIQQNAPKKIKEILAVFWLTHTNDEFFNYNSGRIKEEHEIVLQLIEKYEEQQNEIEKMATTINKDSFRILELARIIEEIAKACYLTWTQKEYDFLGIQYSTNHQITIKNIIEHFEKGRK